MGKAEVARMPEPVSKQVVHVPETESISVEKLKFPPNFEILKNQVAGHMNDGQSLGMLRSNGTVLKPITKPCGERERLLYEELELTNDTTLIALKEFIPKYYGMKTLNVNGKDVTYIELDDLTKHYKEPCIMDIKIGKRTWDPTATYDKIVNEDKKYQDCKRELGFCIPGFQVYKISNNRLCRYGKEYGKKLNKDTIVDAIRIFLNAEMGLCRTLLVQLLTNLWRILHWSRNQRRLRLFSSSILLIYDARRLREHLKRPQNGQPHRQEFLRTQSLYRPMSLAVLNKTNNDDRMPTGFSGLLTKEGPILSRPVSSGKVRDFVATEPPQAFDHPWRKTIRALKRTHSFQNNYDKDLQSKKQDYTYILEDLVDEDKSEIWSSVKMIDFAHVFPVEDGKVDANYLCGIESLVKVFEDFLAETNYL